MPSERRRLAIHSGDVPTDTPSISRPYSRPHSAGSTISTEAVTPEGPGPVGAAGLSWVNGTPRRAARSRATPATDMASGRLGLTSRS